jgi:sodium:alanine symporter family protein
MLVCTVIGLTIVLTGSYGGHQEGAAMTTIAFERGLPIPVLGKYVVNIGLIFFAFTTILGWNYYGEKCMEYLMGIKSIKPYRVIFISLVAVGSFLPLGLIFIIADIVNGLMAIPNLIGIIGLRKEVVDETRKFFIAEKEKKKKK